MNSQANFDVFLYTYFVSLFVLIISCTLNYKAHHLPKLR
jgi:hypothetical protein